MTISARFTRDRATCSSRTSSPGLLNVFILLSQKSKPEKLLSGGVVRVSPQIAEVLHEYERRIVLGVEDSSGVDDRPNCPGPFLFQASERVPGRHSQISLRRRGNHAQGREQFVNVLVPRQDQWILCQEISSINPSKRETLLVLFENNFPVWCSYHYASSQLLSIAQELCVTRQASRPLETVRK